MIAVALVPPKLHDGTVTVGPCDSESEELLRPAVSVFGDEEGNAPSLLSLSYDTDGLEVLSVRDKCGRFRGAVAIEADERQPVAVVSYWPADHERDAADISRHARRLVTAWAFRRYDIEYIMGPET